ncbi:MAG TPA: VTT domain-containing protein [Gemmatimonadaceae bacterium]|nr:VTT domain-containing protein [Gemmatimonadaceae bacterium]
MDQLLDLFHRLTNVRELIAWGGYVGLTLVIFAETGLLVGFFLPGDSLIVTAGLFAALGQFDVWLLGGLLSVASIVGNTSGYYIGYYTGNALYSRPDSLLFKRKHLRKAHDFYEKHGGATVLLARFMPIVRTFVPVVAGVARMNVRRYTFYNVVGGLAWIWGMLFIGYFLGRYIPGIDRHIEVVIMAVIAISLTPGVIAWRRARRRAVSPEIARDA